MPIEAAQILEKYLRRDPITKRHEITCNGPIVAVTPNGPRKPFRQIGINVKIWAKIIARETEADL